MPQFFRLEERLNMIPAIRRFQEMERYLIEHCSPTLASLKTANLFSLRCSDTAELTEQLQFWNGTLHDKGITITLLQWRRDMALIYIFRRSALQADLNRSGVGEFLTKCGYTSTDVDEAIEKLTDRLRNSETFTHEIGIFLGYPLGDVVGFIENRGKNFKHSGFWKVYCNESETIKKFEKFKKCTELYLNLWHSGKSICQLAVTA